MSLSQAVLLDTYPREQHGQAMAIWGMGVMVGPILGPTLSGWLTEYYSWRWVFYINLPAGLIAWLGILTFVPETPRQRRPFDLFGFLMLSLSIGALQMMLDRGESQDWFESLEMIAEATLPAELRNEATSMFSLMRNIGSSIGIAVVTALLSRNTQINHAVLSEHITPYNRQLEGFAASGALADPGTLTQLNAEVTRQARPLSAFSTTSG